MKSLLSFMMSSQTKLNVIQDAADWIQVAESIKRLNNHLFFMNDSSLIFYLNL
jgi:hypothetical protein